MLSTDKLIELITAVRDGEHKKLKSFSGHENNMLYSHCAGKYSLAEVLLQLLDPETDQSRLADLIIQTYRELYNKEVQ